MSGLLQCGVVLSLMSMSSTDPSPFLNFNYPKIKDEYDQTVNLMQAVKSPHLKKDEAQPSTDDANKGSFDFSQFDEYLKNHADDNSRDHNRVKRKAKRRRGGRNGRRRGGKPRPGSTNQPEEETEAPKNTTTTARPVAGRRANNEMSRQGRPVGRNYDTYNPPVKQYEINFVEMPKDLYQAHLRPGVVFRIHMSEAILKMQYRNYGEDRDESVIEADVEYLRLTRKVINDEITKFEDLKWLMGWFRNRTDLMQEHTCNTRYWTVGTPPTMFTHNEEYMKRMCLFDNVYIDHIPYVVGEDGSLMAAVAPPVLHCDAATCTSVPFIDSIMFDERLSRTNVRTVTRCQASCRAHCRNDPDCLKRCTDRCLRAD